MGPGSPRIEIRGVRDDKDIWLPRMLRQTEALWIETEDVMSTFLSLAKFRPLRRLVPLTAAILVFAVASVADAAKSKQTQQSFKTPQEAVDALANAVKSGDQKGMLAVLGRDGE